MDSVVNNCRRCKKDFKAKTQYSYCYPCLSFYKDTYKWKDCNSCQKSFRMAKDKNYRTCYPCISRSTREEIEVEL